MDSMKPSLTVRRPILPDGAFLLRLGRLLRVHQWTKNALCLAGVVFSGRFADPKAVQLAIAVTVLFCLASSSVYIWNDIHDRERDRHHPTKCRRPIASGEVSIPAAIVFATALIVVSLSGSFWLGWPALVCLSLYVVNNVLYSVWIKHLLLFDVLSIVLGFVLRLVAGVYVVGELPTAWIILCTFFLAAFLGFAKRRAELYSHANGGESGRAPSNPRPVLRQYTIDYLDFLISSLATMAIMSYAMFATTSGKSPSLIVTLPIVYYAIMHYKHLVMVGQIGQEPDRILLKDLHILLSLVVWLALFMLIWLGKIHVIR